MKKMKNYKTAICLIVFLFALTNSAQGQIKIPKIFKPKPNSPPPAPQPQTPARDARPQAEQPFIAAPGENYLDDGFTWFEAVSTQELNEQHRPVSTGWALRSELRLIGNYPRRSAFKVNVSRGGKILATNRCEAYISGGDGGVEYIFSGGACVDKTKTVKEVGKFDVEIIAVNGDTDAETSVRKYKIEVFKVERIGGGFSNPQPDAPHYYISRHAEAPASLLFLRPKGAHSYTGPDDRDRTFADNSVEIYFNLSPGTVDFRSGYLRCTVDGKPLEMQNDKVESTVARFYAEVYTDRLAPQYKNGTEYRDEIRFSWVRADLPFTYGSGADGWETNLSNHPGNWECSLMNNGATWRTWRWTILPNGMPQKHPEQKSGVNLFPTAFLIDTEIPAGGAAIDKRLAPISAAEGFFYGQPWISGEGKAMAAKVPAKGNPAPVASNKIK